MKKTLSLAISAAALAYAPAVSAGTFLPSTSGTEPDGSTWDFTVTGDGTTGTDSVSASLGRTGISTSGVDSWVFTIGPNSGPLDGTVIGLGSGSVITSFSFQNVSGLVFDLVEFNNGNSVFNIPLTTTPSGTIIADGNDIPVISGNLNTLSVNYTALGNNASYGGNLTFAPVPEPMTWAMMILGFVAVGFAMRRRREDQTARVRYAF